MDRNPYAPPIAIVEDVEPARTAAQTPPFFAVSVTKLVILSVCTLGLYELYWFYKNWQLIRLREASNISPGARAFFAIIFCYQCFSRIRTAGVEAGITPALPAGALAIGWVLLTLTWRLPDPYWLLAYAAIAFLVPVQSHVNRINAAVAPGHDANDRLTGWNWLWISVGGLILILAMIGLFLPEQ
jgi:hypothetical protein